MIQVEEVAIRYSPRDPNLLHVTVTARDGDRVTEATDEIEAADMPTFLKKFKNLVRYIERKANA